MNDVPSDPLASPSLRPYPAEPSRDARPAKPAPLDRGVQPEAGASPPNQQLKSGRVIRVTPEQVFLEMGDQPQGFVPLIEFAGQPLPKVGDEFPVIVDRADPATGLLVLSKRQADELSFWEAVKPGDILEGVVTGMNKGGLDIDLGGARAFLPASQVDVQRMRDISLLIGEHIRCIVTQVDRTTRDIVVSRRKHIEKEARQKRAEFLKTLTEGTTRTGTITKLTDFGAFVDLGGAEGLVHVTDMSWSRIRNPKELLEEGQQLDVVILKVSHKTGKVSLGLKQTRPDPWEGVESRYPVDSRVKGRVLRLADFGAFVELEEAVEALLPISEMSWSKRIGHPCEMVKVGDELELVVLKVDPAQRRISLGLKQTEENPWNTVATRFPPNSKVNGKVSKIVEYGAFVELTPGIDGLIHISELSESRVRAVTDVLQEGQEVEVRVLKVDREAQRVSLSLRPPRTGPAGRGAAATQDKKTQRKRPLRGGLSSHFQW